MSAKVRFEIDLTDETTEAENTKRITVTDNGQPMVDMVDEAIAKADPDGRCIADVIGYEYL